VLPRKTQISYIICLMTAMLAQFTADTDSTWRAEFRALVLEIDRRAVALDVRYWPRTAPGGALSVIEHLQLLHQRWRVVPVVAPAAFVPDPAPAAAVRDASARAVRPAALLRSWRREGRTFPDRLAAGYARSGGPSAEARARQYRAELTALCRCLAAFPTVAPVGATEPDR